MKTADLSAGLFKMMMTQALLAGLTSIALAHNHAPGSVNSVWSDAKGLQSVTHCRPSTEKDIGLRLSHGAILKSRIAGEIQLPERTLMRVTAVSQSASQVDAQVVALAQNIGQNQRSPMSGRGLVSQTEVQVIDDSVFEIQDASIVEKLKGQFLQIAMSEDKYNGVNCKVGGENKKYYVFNVYSPNQVEATSQIGVSLEELTILRNVKIYSADEAEDLLNEQEEKKQSTVDPVTPTGGSSAAATPGSVSAPVSSNGSNSGKETPVAGSGEKKAATETKPTLNPKIAATVQAGQAAVKAGAKDAKNQSKVDEEDDIDEEEDESDEAKEAEQNQSVAETVLTSVICTADDPKLAVRDEKMSKVLFHADRFEEVKIVQGWTAPKDSTLAQVIFAGRKSGENTGWVQKKYVRMKAECAPLQLKLEEEANSAEGKARKKTNAGIIGKIKGLNDPNCCVFPTLKRPTTSYKEGMRRFRAGRGGGRRLHAACDLYRLHGDAAVAVAPGKVIRGVQYFYQGVYAVEVLHSGGFVVRYGEILARTPKDIKLGAVVSPGQVIGYIGTVNSGCCKPMLHIELYKGTVSGPLSQKKRRPYQRRGDLLDPTNYLSRWEQKQFGSSY